MIVMKKVRSGNYYTGQNRDGYASLEREGVRLGLQFVWRKNDREQKPVESKGDESAGWQAWKITVTDIHRRRRVWKVRAGEIAGDDQKPWHKRRKTFGLMVIPAVDMNDVRDELNRVVCDGMAIQREQNVPEKPGVETGFLVIDREGELVSLSIYGADMEVLMGKQAYEKIRRLMEVLTGQFQPPDNNRQAGRETGAKTQPWEPEGVWMDALQVRAESVHRDRLGTDNVWWGGLAARLGVEGALIGRDDLELALGGYVPGLVEGKPVPIMSNAGHPRRKKGTDIVFSAPKAYSLLWAHATPDRQRALEILNRETVKQTLAWWVQKGLGYTEEDNGRKWNRESELLVGLFEHGSSRDKDPHLHTHCIVVNLTGNRRRLVINNRYALAADYEYRRGLCAGLQRMGYPALPSLSHGIWVEGVSDGYEEMFSRRRQTILELAQGGGAQVRRRIAMLTRRPKVQSREEIHLAAKDEWEKVIWGAMPQVTDLPNPLPTQRATSPVSGKNPPLTTIPTSTLFSPEPAIPEPEGYPEPNQKIGNRLQPGAEPPPGNTPETGTDKSGEHSTPNLSSEENQAAVSPLDVFRTIALSRGQIVALDEEVIALSRLMQTREGQSPPLTEIRRWLSTDHRLVSSAGYWLESHTAAANQRCGEKIKTMLRENRLTIVDEQEAEGNHGPDVCWLSPGAPLPVRSVRESRGIRPVGLRQAHWWTAQQLEPLLDSSPPHLILKMPLSGPRLPGYPARELWWKEENHGKTLTGHAEAETGYDPVCAGDISPEDEPGVPAGQLTLPLETRKRAPTGQGRTMKDGYYRNGCGFHATADEFIANFGYDVMLHRRAVVVSDAPAEWEPKIEEKLLSMGIIGEEPVGEFRGLAWRMNERIGWQPRNWKREGWLWGEVRGATFVPEENNVALWVETWKGELIQLKEDDVRSVRCGYAVHPSEIRNATQLRCHYYFPRPTTNETGMEKRRGQDRRREITAALQYRPAKGHLFIGVEPYRKRWYALPHARFLESEKRGLPGIAPAGSNRKILTLVMYLCRMGGGQWQLVDETGITELHVDRQETWDAQREGREWEAAVLETVENALQTKDPSQPWFLQWNGTAKEERRLVIHVNRMDDVLAMRQNGLAVEIVTSKESGYELWMKWPRYENETLPPAALGEYLREICRVENFILQEKGEIPERWWKCAAGNQAGGNNVLHRLPIGAWEKMQREKTGRQENYPVRETTR